MPHYTFGSDGKVYTTYTPEEQEAIGVGIILLILGSPVGASAWTFFYIQGEADNILAIAAAVVVASIGIALTIGLTADD